MKSLDSIARIAARITARIVAGVAAVAVTLSAQTRETLFDGRTLKGWHALGEATWTVSDGAVHGLNPARKWAHLVTDRTFTDGYVRVRYFNRIGNSGLYVRGSEGGDFQVKGMQVDFGTAWDGSVMRVTDSTWGWIEEVRKASDSGWAKAGQWNELAVDVQGTSLKTYINGRLVWQSTRVAGMATSGRFALQLHDGDANDISFKDIELLLPTRVPHCPNPSDPAYGPGNDPDMRLCRNPVGLALPAYKEERAPRTDGWAGNPEFLVTLPGNSRWFDLRGKSFTHGKGK
jgi:hypothetical protein